MRLVDADMAEIYLNTVACEQIKNMPTVKAKLIISGEWIKIKLEHSGIEFFRCSSCDYGVSEREMQEFDYCPKCGADMQKEKKR